MMILASSDITTWLVQQGPLGIILVGLLGALFSGRFVLGREHDRVIDENKDLRRQVPDTIAAVTASTEAIKEATQVMRDVVVVLQVMQQRRQR